MVTYEFVSEDDKSVVFHYYPEGKKEYKPGIIVIDLDNLKIDIVEMAQGDIDVIITLEEQLDMRNSSNEIRIEEGRDPLTKEEWPIPTQDIVYKFYGSHAISKIVKDYNNGCYKDGGVAFWY